MNIHNIKSWLRDERDFVNSTTTTATENISAFADVAGMLSLPLIPATLTSLTIYFTLQQVWPLWSSIALGVLVAVGLESLGIAASKTAMRLYRAYRDKITLRVELAAVIITTAVYVLLVTSIITFGEGLPPQLRWIGYASPLLAVSMYVVVGFNADLQEKREREWEAREFENNLDNELRIAKLKDKKERIELQRVQEQAEFNLKLELKKVKAEAKIKNNMESLLTPQEMREEALKFARDNLHLSGAKIAAKFGRSQRWGEIIKKEAK